MDVHMQFCGYKIASGTEIVLCATAIQHNSEYWPHPEVFDPERFRQVSWCVYMTRLIDDVSAGTQNWYFLAFWRR